MKILSNLEKIIEIRGNETLIEYDNKKLTFKIFWEKVLKLANYFHSKKLNKISVIETEKEDFFFYIVIFASLIAGKTYIPIGANVPIKRIKKILDLSKADIVITSKNLNKFSTNIFHPKYIDNLKNKYKFKIKKSNNDAYIIFTSGSTGEPKGVRISRKALDKYILWILETFFNDKIIRCSQHPSIGFDLSIADIFGTICSGGKLFPIKKKIDKIFLKKFVIKNKLTHWISVPSLTDIIFNSRKNKNEFKNIKKIFFCGEVLRKNHLKKIFECNKNIQVMNAYGPTEATVSCTIKKFNFKNYYNFCKPTASFGKPIKGIQLSFTSNNKKEGELVISGDQVSNGYLNNSKLNNLKFIEKRNKRSFITGDLCKKINGEFYFLNRKDRQIKLYGHRIELDEIDNLISDKTGNTSLSLKRGEKIVTFINGKLNKSRLIKYLKTKLPSYMIPSNINLIKEWPKNKNYKIDEKKLLSIKV